MRIGEVYLMKFEGTGNEQQGWRPGVVFQNNVGNTDSPNIIALPLTSSLKKLNQPTHVVVSASDSGLKCDSMVLCENPEKMSKDRVGKYLTTLSDKYMAEVARGHLVATSALSFLTAEQLLEIWKQSIKMNSVAA